MVSDILIRIGQIILAILLVVFVLYKLALSLDMVPEDFSPKGVVINEYKSFKQELAYQAGDPDIQGKVSGFVLRGLERIEKHIDTAAKKSAEADAVEAKCEENSIFRFFMFMGDDKGRATKCSESNLNLKNADKELHMQSAKPVVAPKIPANVPPT